MEKRMGGSEKQVLFNVMAAEKLLEEEEPNAKRMFERIKDGWRDYRLITTTLSKMVENTLLTIPRDQLMGIAKQAQKTEIRVGAKMGNSRRDDVFWVMSGEEIHYLILAAIEGKCLMCEDETGYGCMLKRLIDETPCIADGATLSATCPCMKGR